MVGGLCGQFVIIVYIQQIYAGGRMATIIIIIIFITVIPTF